MAFSFFGLGRLFRSYSDDDKGLANSIEAITGVKPRNLELYKLAVRHSSTGQLSSNRAEHNERLEYLGDAVLGTIVAHYLFQRYPLKNEGFLTEIRARMVNGEALNDLALKIGLDKLVKYEGRRKQVHTHRSMYGDAMEALVGAFYLDFGFDSCRRFVTERLLNPHYDLEQLVESETNHKSRLIEWSQKNGYKISFDIIKEAGRNHTREFTAQVTLEGLTLATGTGFSKKKAEQSAALKAYDRVNEGRLPENLRKRPHVPIQRTDSEETTNQGGFRDHRNERLHQEGRHGRGERAEGFGRERREGRSSEPREGREGRQDRPQESREPREGREPRGDRSQEVKTERQQESREGRAHQEPRPERSERQDRPERPERTERPERLPRQDREPRKGRYTVSTPPPEEEVQPDLGAEPVTGLMDSSLGEASLETTSQEGPAKREKRPDRRHERGGRGHRNAQVEGGTIPENQSPNANTEENTGDLEETAGQSQQALPDRSFGKRQFEEDYSDKRKESAIGSTPPEENEPAAIFPVLPPLPEPKRRWVNVMKQDTGKKEAEGAGQPEEKISDSEPVSDAPREQSPALDSWDKEFAQVAGPDNSEEIASLPKAAESKNDEGLQVADEETDPIAKENPDWINEAAEEFRSEVLKAEENFKDAGENLSLKPEEPGTEPGDNADAPK